MVVDFYHHADGFGVGVIDLFELIKKDVCFLLVERLVDNEEGDVGFYPQFRNEFG